MQLFCGDYNNIINKDIDNITAVNEDIDEIYENVTNVLKFTY